MLYKCQEEARLKNLKGHLLKKYLGEIQKNHLKGEKHLGKHHIAVVKEVILEKHLNLK